MFLERKPLGVYAANGYIAACEKSKEAIVVDPGGEPEEVVKIVDENGFKLKYIILTHGHGDHIGAVNDLVAEYGSEVLVHEDDAELLEDSEKNLSSMMPGKPVTVEKYTTVKEGDSVKFGDNKARFIHTPGHTRGCMCIKTGDFLFTGDTLFKGSIGRTDLYGGGDDILESINEKIYPLDDDIKILPGHGAITTVGAEKKSNPFLLGISRKI